MPDWLTSESSLSALNTTTSDIPVSAAIAVGALVALFRFKLGVMPLLGGCAVVGLLVKVAVPYFA